MESKYSEESKVAETKIGDAPENRKLDKLLAKREDGDVLANLYPFYQAKISHGLEEFYERYVETFDPEEEENKLEYWDIFKKFEALFEGYLQEFIDEQRLDEDTFNEELKRVAEKASGKSKILIKLVAAQSDYDFFVNLMKDKARELRKKQNLTNKK